MRPWARIVLLLVVLVPGVSFAQSANSPSLRYWGCVSTRSGVLPETWHEDLDTPHLQCLNFFITSSPGNVSYTSVPVPLVGPNGRELVRVSHNFSGIRTSDGTPISWSVYEYICTNPQDRWVTLGDPNVSYCEATDTELKNADIATFSGYLIGAFFIGYSMGYLFRVFYKIADHV